MCGSRYFFVPFLAALSVAISLIIHVDNSQIEPSSAQASPRAGVIATPPQSVLKFATLSQKWRRPFVSGSPADRYSTPLRRRL